MIKKIVILVAFVFLVAGLLFFARGKKAFFGSLDGWFFGQAPKVGRLSTTKSWVVKVSDEAAVTIEAQPVNLSAESSDFRLVFTTHSVDLNFSLLEKARLFSGADQVVKPLAWDGDRGGHHLSGVLKFPAFPNPTQSFKLIIADDLLGPERVFEWVF